MKPKDMMKIAGAEKLTEIPMSMLLPNERQAVLNHGQSLHRLNERGGLHCSEALAIIDGRGWGQVHKQPDDEQRLTTLMEGFI